MSIDYGTFPDRNGLLPNRDPVTGIRYGIVSLGSLNEYALDAFEPIEVCSCPVCGTEMADDFEPETDECPSCGHQSEFSEDWYGDPIGWKHESNGYSLWLDESNDVWVFKSPFTTSKWSHCSPCAPGAAHLSGTEDHGSDLAYCLGPDWYETDAE